ncbi:hypothetical protein C8J56DRAFT_144563 [Mycena floridula]|nr:hypothetical protein C8J56DRAFT_144563 [Mycena floridula]
MALLEPTGHHLPRFSIVHSGSPFFLAWPSTPNRYIKDIFSYKDPTDTEMATNSRPTGLSLVSLIFLIALAVFSVLAHTATFRFISLGAVIFITGVNISYELSIDLIVETIIMSIASLICFHDEIQLTWIFTMHFIATVKLAMVAVLSPCLTKYREQQTSPHGTCDADVSFPLRPEESSCPRLRREASTTKYPDVSFPQRPAEPSCPRLRRASNTTKYPDVSFRP